MYFNVFDPFDLSKAPVEPLFQPLRGNFPSLGYCAARKKDGLNCSMPCDKEKTAGRLVPRWKVKRHPRRGSVWVF